MLSLYRCYLMASSDLPALTPPRPVLTHTFYPIRTFSLFLFSSSDFHSDYGEFEFRAQVSNQLADHHQPNEEMRLSDSVQRFRPKVVYGTGQIATVDNEKYYLRMDLEVHHAASVQGPLEKHGQVLVMFNGDPDTMIVIHRLVRFFRHKLIDEQVRENV